MSVCMSVLFVCVWSVCVCIFTILCVGLCGFVFVCVWSVGLGLLLGLRFHQCSVFSTRQSLNSRTDFCVSVYVGLCLFVVSLCLIFCVSVYVGLCLFVCV